MIALILSTLALAGDLRPPRNLTSDEFSIVSDTLQDAWTFWEVDMDDPSIYTTRYVWANRKSVELLKIDRYEARGKTFAETVVDAESEGGRRWVMMYTDAIRTNRPVRLPEAPYDGKVYEVTILPVTRDLIVVLFQVVDRAPHNNLEISDEDWLRIQFETLDRLQRKTEKSIEELERTAEEQNETMQDILYGQEFSQSPMEFEQTPMEFEQTPIP